MEDATLLKQMVHNREIDIDAWVERCIKAEKALDRMILALTPSSATKAALIGEFKFSIWFANEVLEGRAALEQKNLAFVRDNRDEYSGDKK